MTNKYRSSVFSIFSNPLIHSVFTTYTAYLVKDNSQIHMFLEYTACHCSWSTSISASHIQRPQGYRKTKLWFQCKQIHGRMHTVWRKSEWELLYCSIRASFDFASNIEKFWPMHDLGHVEPLLLLRSHSQISVGWIHPRVLPKPPSLDV